MLMRKILKTLSIIVTLGLVSWVAQAQKIGNGGNFSTDQARVIIDKFVLVIKNNILRELNPIDIQLLDALENTKKVFDLNGENYSALSQFIIITQSAKTVENKNTLCVIGSTELLSSILGQNSTGELIKKISQHLVALDSLDESLKSKVNADLIRGMNENLIDPDCSLK